MSPSHPPRDGGCDGPEASSRLLDVGSGVQVPLSPVPSNLGVNDVSTGSWVLYPKIPPPKTVGPGVLILHGLHWVVNAGWAVNGGVLQ